MLDPRKAKRLIVYGGSFDPPHRAHVELPFHVARQIGADGVLFVPAARPPHKSRTLTADEHRLAMLELALDDREDAAIWRGELKRTGPSYTVETLRRLRHELGPDIELRLLIGADMASIFHDWREPREIERLAEPVVMMRPPVNVEQLIATLPPELDDPARQRWRSRIVAAPQIDADSTRLRQMLTGGRYDDPDVKKLIPGAVLDYIRRHRIYES